MAEKKEKKYVSDNAQLMAEWDWEKNNELGFNPQELTCGSGKKVWWKCEKGHEWEAAVFNRNKGKGCPYCAGRKVLKGFNDLLTNNPALAQEWNYKKNGNLRPEHFTSNSEKKIWWKCKKGHEWEASIAHRNNGRNCPVCNSEQNTSFPEYVLIFYIQKYGLEVIHSYKENGYELDVYIPSKKTAIEYDGYYWHKNKIKYDLHKNLQCKNDGITLYRIREGLPPLNDTSKDYVIEKNQKNFAITVEKILSEVIGDDINIDLQRDAILIENQREYTEKRQSLLYTMPQIAREWNYKKNGNLRPEHVTPNSQKKVWWKCKKGHEWQATISHRTNGRNCPYCSGKKVLAGYNDLQSINPALAKEWNYKKNESLRVVP